MKTLQKSVMWLMAVVACIQTTQTQASNKNGGTISIGNGGGVPRSTKAPSLGTPRNLGNIGNGGTNTPRKIEVPNLGNSIGGSTNRIGRKPKIEPIVGGPGNLLNQTPTPIVLKDLKKSPLPFPGQTPTPTIPKLGSGSPNSESVFQITIRSIRITTITASRGSTWFGTGTILARIRVDGLAEPFA